jgi:hypothetical protein
MFDFFLSDAERLNTIIYLTIGGLAALILMSIIWEHVRELIDKMRGN